MKFHRNERGGIVLEASLILPLFMSFILAFIMLIQISLIELALQSAVSESVKTISANIYPVKLIADKVKDNVESNESYTKIIETMQQVFAFHTSTSDSKGWVEQFIDYFSKTFFVPARNYFFSSMVYYFANHQILERDRLQVVQVEVPDIINGTDPFFGIEVQYKYRLPVPFLSREIILSKRAYERVWLGA